MRRALGVLLSGFLLGTTACLAVLELALAWGWLRGTLYVARYGAAENPYAAEDAEIAGFCALLLLPLFLAVLAWTAHRMILRQKDRAEARSER